MKTFLFSKTVKTLVPLKQTQLFAFWIPGRARNDGFLKDVMPDLIRHPGYFK